MEKVQMTVWTSVLILNSSLKEKNSLPNEMLCSVQQHIADLTSFNWYKEQDGCWVRQRFYASLNITVSSKEHYNQLAYIVEESPALKQVYAQTF